jgi:TonB-dependent SusC/RagA subfamily outer membrane receptor
MMRHVRVSSLFSLFFLAAASSTAAAQGAVTITGHVSSASMPVRGASVRIEALDLGALTDPEGRYSFIVPSSRVRGQTVTLSVRYLRYRSQSVEITLVGGSLVRDFELTAGDEAPGVPRPRPAEAPAPGAQPSQRPPSNVAPSAASPAPRTSRVTAILSPVTVDSTAFMDLAGPTDLPTALAGRLPGVDVTSSTTPGGTSSILVRGPHSLFGLTQPLMVVNGIILDNNNITTASQRSGLGGFDYGSSVNDLNLEDIASVQLLTGPAAAMRYGGRAANGVLLIATKNAWGLNGMDVSASQQYSSESSFRLPTYQNLYGQGLGGKFSFFDGKGGGVNDAVDQSWGPALDGSPVPQASYLEASRADVRAFVPLPNNVHDYFITGRTLATNAAVQGSSESGQFRVALSNRNSTGLTPQTRITRQAGVVTAGGQPSARLSLNGDLQLYSDRGEDRPGTGFDESNPVSVFSHMGRQVDIATLMTHLRDPLQKQVSWNYSGHNNPYFAALQNDNHDERTRYLGGASATYDLSSWLSATARAGTDHSSDKRSFTVAQGWMGGFPYYLGRGDFSTGGFESDDITSTQTNANLVFRAAPRPTGATSFVFTAGADIRGDELQTSARGADHVSDTTTIVPMDWRGTSSTKSVFGGVEAMLHDYASLNVTARTESASQLSGASSSTFYPAVLGTIDFARMDSVRPAGRTLGMFAVHAGWSRSGNDATAAFLQRLGVSAATSAATLAQLSAPELTSGWEVGTSIRMYDSRFGVDANVYDESSENLVFPSGSSFARTGTLSNKGVDASVLLVPLRSASGLEWSIGVTVAKNSNTVESLAGGVGSVALGSSYGGLTVEARTGNSLGTLVGTRFLRDGAGQLLLQNGHPLPDSITGPTVLGQSAPSWIGGLSTSLRKGALEVSLLVDVHHGGQFFSASNRSGAVSGMLDETAFRPDTGLLIAGTDAATGAPNTKHVTTEDYYHSLAPITERWLYDASFMRLREARISLSLPLHVVSALRAQSVRLSLVGRNLALWSNAPNIDPENVLSASTFRGAEMGQLPTARSLGVQLSLTP